MILLRIAFGIALAVPSPSTGYSLLQDSVMRVVTAGVALADDTWNAALNYMNNGGTLYLSAKQQKGSLNTETATAILGPAKQVFNSEVCMLQSRKITAQNRQESSGTKSSPNSVNNLFVPSGNQPVDYNIYEDQKNNTIYFPGIGNTLPFNPNTENSSLWFNQRDWCV